MATSPATAPVAAPIVVALPCWSHSGISHPSTADAAPSCVATNALLARPPTARALPALNPNHPNHKMPAPRITIGTLWGTNALDP
jgi:hypothetical protein